MDHRRRSSSQNPPWVWVEHPHLLLGPAVAVAVVDRLLSRHFQHLRIQCFLVMGALSIHSETEGRLLVLPSPDNSTISVGIISTMTFSYLMAMVSVSSMFTSVFAVFGVDGFWSIAQGQLVWCVAKWV